MRNIEAVLKKGWWCFELPGYRNHPESATYSLFDYEALPPITEPLDEGFTWLRAEPLQEGSLADNEEEEEDYGKEWEPLESRLKRITDYPGLPLPDSFTTFLSSPDLQARIRSCTACFLLLPNNVVRTTGIEEGFLIHFLSDQQWCLHWHLYVSASGEHCVIVSREAYGVSFEEEEPPASEAGAALELKEAPVWFCAPSFPEFIYRFWLENEIWFRLAWEKQPLTARQQAYVDHYKRPAS